MDIKVKHPDKYMDSAIFTRETGCSLYTLDGDLYITGADSQAHAEQLLADHNPVDVHKLKEEAIKSASAKLAALGLTTDDLKALGL